MAGAARPTAASTALPRSEGGLFELVGDLFAERIEQVSADDVAVLADHLPDAAEPIVQVELPIRGHIAVVPGKDLPVGVAIGPVDRAVFVPILPDWDQDILSLLPFRFIWRQNSAHLCTFRRSHTLFGLLKKFPGFI